MKASAESITPATQAKIDTWRRQHAALDSPAYRISFISRTDALKTFVHGKGRGEHGGERFYDADEIEGLIPFAAAKNIKGYEVYITPIDDDWHYLVVDDMQPPDYERLIGAGYRPCIVIESSPGNRQAILKTSKPESSHAEQSAANKIVQRLNDEVGDDEFTGAVHAFRMAAFSNKKPGKGSPFVKVIEATGATCERTAERVQMARELIQKRQSEQPARKTGNGAQARHAEQSNDNQESISGAADEYRRRTRHLASDSDWSAMDFGTAYGMLNEGWPRAAVEQAIVEASPGIAERHPDVLGYVRRTLDAVEHAKAGG